MDYKILEIEIDKLITTSNGCYVVMLGPENDQRLMSLDEQDSTILSFFFTGYGEVAHIKTIHQIFSTFLESSKYKIINSEIIAYEEGIGYGRIKITKNKTPIYFLCGLSDCLIISIINRIPILCNSNVWNLLDEYDEEMESDYNQEF